VMLELEDAIPFLLEQDLLDERTLVENDVSVMDMSRRNQDLMVNIGRDAGYFLKQSKRRSVEGALAHEARIYRSLLLGSEGSTCMARHIPRYVAYDSDRDVLILEKVQNATSLRLYRETAGPYALMPSKALAGALSTLHHLDREALDSEDQTVPSQTPWALTIHQPSIEVLRDISGANVRLLEIIQAHPSLCGFMDNLRAEWASHGCIHGDMRSDNCLVTPAPDSRRKTRAVVVDWEGACLGDPCWDVAAIFADCLRTWVRSMPMGDSESLERSIDWARRPLDRLAPSLRAFWRLYVSHMGFDRQTRGRQLARTMRLTAPRLIQLTYEELQGAATITSWAPLILQLSLNLLEQPLPAARHLFGISSRGAGCDVNLA
jgi:aminoglycoside phosphotransferase (APT) family kinase protein